MAKRKNAGSIESAFSILSDVTLEGARRATDRAIFCSAYGSLLIKYRFYKIFTKILALKG
jgi:hypothetical protein